MTLTTTEIGMIRDIGWLMLGCIFCLAMWVLSYHYELKEERRKHRKTYWSEEEKQRFFNQLKN